MAVPPLSSSGVFTVADSILIDAPREKVWQILLDFPSYKEWNAFVRGQTLVSPTGTALADQTPTADTLMHISPVHLPPTMGEPRFMGSHSTVVRITAMDHEHFRAAWETAGGLPRWALFAERWQMLTVEDGKTRYESVEVFSGILAYVVKLFTGRNLVLGGEGDGGGA
ncbi:hypothetical protein MVEN_02601400 [Mycena venus]|uniref:Coenzyme Q-binding protein COQ10 START domain-containing protein n=1 Tax=Mycena venus TaxID=2733690 RepID=A0A8H6WT47_9AGAR|nr:hypothetical protein MVEN_02601400 [Mycena venus]